MSFNAVLPAFARSTIHFPTHKSLSASWYKVVWTEWDWTYRLKLDGKECYFYTKKFWITRKSLRMILRETCAYRQNENRTELKLLPLFQDNIHFKGNILLEIYKTNFSLF